MQCAVARYEIPTSILPRPLKAMLPQSEHPKICLTGAVYRCSIAQHSIAQHSNAIPSSVFVPDMLKHRSNSSVVHLLSKI